jgi:hypothetical protein
MAFADCIANLVAAQEITRAEARRLVEAYDELAREAQLAGHADPRGAARSQLALNITAEGEEQKRIAHLADAARHRILTDIAGYRVGATGAPIAAPPSGAAAAGVPPGAAGPPAAPGGTPGVVAAPGPAGGITPPGVPDIMEASIRLLEHYGFTGYSSVEGRFKAIVGSVQAKLEQALTLFDRSALAGTRRERPLMQDVVRSLFGENVSDIRAQTLAKQFETAFEDLRLRANAAGMSIGKLTGFGLPQSHDPAAIISAGRDQWKQFITPLLDRQRMRDPLTGAVMSDTRLSAALDVAYKRIVSDGSYGVAPSIATQGQGPLWKQRAEHRFLHFKDADSWMQYATAFAQPDPFATAMLHVKGMARDIAAMEILGPNPDATIHWLKGVIEAERAKFLAGETSLYRASSTNQAFDKAGLADWRLDSLWSQISGGEIVSGKVAMGFATVRNLITSAALGSTAISAIATDPAIGNIAKRLSGMPTRFWVTEMVRTVFGGLSRPEAIRAGLVLEDALHLVGEEARFAGTQGGATWARWASDRVLTWSGLTPWTQARKHIFGTDFQGFMADQAQKTWADLPPLIKRTMNGYGISPADWDAMRAAPLYTVGGSAGLLRPAEIERVAGREVAERYLEMILSETERAVPSGTKRSKALMAVGGRGTIMGEVAQGALQFKAFGLSMMTLQLEAIRQELGRGAVQGAAYIGALAISTTLGGAIAVQLRDMIAGKDPQDVSDPKFWLKAAQTGGGFGIFGDFLFADANRLGYSIGETLMGPTINFVNDIAKIPLGAFQKLADDEETSVMKQTIAAFRRYTPGASLWYLRAGWNRVIMDQLEYLTDPQAHKAMRRREKRLQSTTGQEFFWRPGQVAPGRAPDLGAAWPQ